MTTIERFGWRGGAEAGIGRVVGSHGDYYHVVCDEADGVIVARKKKGAWKAPAGGDARVGRDDAASGGYVKTARPVRSGTYCPPNPVTGDFVRFRYNPHGESLITELLPRRSHFERKDPTAKRKAQTLAVNFDTLFVMMSLNEDFSTARIDRYLALAEDMGEAEAVVVVTKADLRQEGDEEFLDELRETVAGRAANTSSRARLSPSSARRASASRRFSTRSRAKGSPRRRRYRSGADAAATPRRAGTF